MLGQPPLAGTASASNKQQARGRLFMMHKVPEEGRTAQKKSDQVSETETTELFSMNSLTCKGAEYLESHVQIFCKLKYYLLEKNCE